MACSACTLAVLTHAAHLYAQLGCGALVASIHVSAHPVAPSEGIVSAVCAPARWRSVVMIGHAAPRTTSPLLNSVSSVAMSGQYFLTSGFWVFSRLTTASN